MTPTTAVTVDCHATTAASCRGVKPRDFKQGQVPPAVPDRCHQGERSATIAPTASPTARITGVEPMLR